MIDNYNESKNPSTGDYVDVKKYIGVASVSVLAVNPNNAMLRKYGWNIEQDAAEPEYSYTKQNEDGSTETYAKVRFLLRINDLTEKPIIAYDIWIRPGFIIGKNTGKCRVIDSFGRCAWATKEDVKARRIPQYTSGPASISNDYKGCHPGQEKLVAFIHKYLNVTPLQIFDSKTNQYVNSKNPGHLTIDDWDKLCKGDATEIAEYLSLQPDNRVKLILGIRTTDKNKTYQAVLDTCDGTTKTCYIGNASRVDQQTGEYTVARKRIDEYISNLSEDYTPDTYSAYPVRELVTEASTVTESTDDIPESVTAPEVDNDYTGHDDNDLPF